MEKKVFDFLKSTKTFLQKHGTPERRIIASALTISVTSGYFLASIVVSIIAPIIVNQIASTATTYVNPTAGSGPSRERLNYHTLQKEIIARNIFNVDGTYPNENEHEAEQEEPQLFSDVNAPCNPSKLPLTLIGTIVMADSNFSLATIKEKDVDDVDVYHIGERLISNDAVSIHDILRNKIIFNNNGHRECLEVDLVPPERREGQLASISKTAKVEGPTENPLVTLEAKWVQSELGDGFEKIVNSSRLVPNTSEDGKVNGFKIFSIRKGTLYDKVGLQDGDIVTKVNETVMDVEHGFALHQAFLDDWDITIQVLRQGQIPLTLKVSVKK